MTTLKIQNVSIFAQIHLIGLASLLFTYLRVKENWHQVLLNYQVLKFHQKCVSFLFSFIVFFLVHSQEGFSLMIARYPYQ